MKELLQKIKDATEPNETLKDDLKEGRRGLQDLIKGTAEVTHGITSGYRHLTDRFITPIEKVIESAATFTGLNMLLSSSIYLFNSGAQHALETLVGQQGMEHFHQVVDGSTLETAYKIALYTLTYGAANLGLPGKLREGKGALLRKGLIGQLTKKVWKRKRKPPSWGKHLKTWTIAGMLAYVIGGTSGQTITQQIDRFLSGNRAVVVAQEAKESISELEQLIEQFSYTTTPEETQKIEEGIRETEKRNREFPYTDQISQDTKIINKRLGTNMTPENLVFLTRLVYWEGAPNESYKGLVAIANTIMNRYKYDLKQEREGRKREFTPKNDLSPFGVAFKHGRNRRGGITWQFSAVKNRGKYFYIYDGTEEGRKRNERMSIYGVDAKGNPVLRIAVGQMQEQQAEKAYRAVRDVLQGIIEDNTRGAIFYQNPAATHGRNSLKAWKRWARITAKPKYTSHVFLTTKRDDGSWREISFPRITYTPGEIPTPVGAFGETEQKNRTTHTTTQHYKPHNEEPFKYLRHNRKGLLVFEYTVQRGDTASRISREFNAWDEEHGDQYGTATANSVRWGNGRRTGNNIHPGNKVYVCVRRHRPRRSALEGLPEIEPATNLEEAAQFAMRENLPATALEAIDVIVRGYQSSANEPDTIRKRKPTIFRMNEEQQAA